MNETYIASGLILVAPGFETRLGIVMAALGLTLLYAERTSQETPE